MNPILVYPKSFLVTPRMNFRIVANWMTRGFWYWLRFPPGFAPSFMLRNSDCRCTRGYKIGHPCRDFRDLCACNACSSVRLYLLEAQANQLHQGLHYEVLNVVVLRRWGQTIAPIGAADIITPEKWGMKNASAFEPERSPGIGEATKKSRDWI